MEYCPQSLPAGSVQTNSVATKSIHREQTLWHWLAFNFPGTIRSLLCWAVLWHNGALLSLRLSSGMIQWMETLVDLSTTNSIYFFQCWGRMVDKCNPFHLFMVFGYLPLVIIYLKFDVKSLFSTVWHNGVCFYSWFSEHALYPQP